jgi:CRISPR type IV-associated protein Csf3
MLKEFEANLVKYAAEQKIYIQRLEGLMDIKIDKSALYKLVSGWVQLKPSEVKAVAEGTHTGQQISTRKSNIITDLSKAYDIEVNGGVVYKKGYNIPISGVGETGFGLLNTVTHYYTHNRDNTVANLLFSDFGKKERQVIEFAESY